MWKKLSNYLPKTSVVTYEKENRQDNINVKNFLAHFFRAVTYMVSLRCMVYYRTWHKLLLLKWKQLFLLRRCKVIHTRVKCQKSTLTWWFVCFLWNMPENTFHNMTTQKLANIVLPDTSWLFWTHPDLSWLVLTLPDSSWLLQA